MAKLFVSLRNRRRRSRVPESAPAEPEPGEAPEPVTIEGRLEEQGLAVVLQLLDMSKSQGRLVVTGPTDVARLTLSDGWVLQASRDYGRKVGDELVARGILDPRDLANVLSLQRRKKVNQPLGVILANLGLVDPDVMRSIVTCHFMDVLREVAQTDVGVFRFEHLDELLRADVDPGALRIQTLVAKLTPEASA